MPPAKRRRMTARQGLALSLRADGLDYGAIGKKLGVTRQTAHGLVMDALARIEVEGAETVRALEVVRLDDALSRVRTILDSPDANDADAVARLTDTLLRLMDRRARMLGLDAPKVTVQENTLDVRLEAPELDAAITAALAARGIEAPALPVEVEARDVTEKARATTVK